jgi:hypothetical protein
VLVEQAFNFGGEAACRIVMGKRIDLKLARGISVI